MFRSVNQGSANRPRQELLDDPLLPAVPGKFVLADKREIAGAVMEHDRGQPLDEVIARTALRALGQGKVIGRVTPGTGRVLLNQA